MRSRLALPLLALWAGLAAPVLGSELPALRPALERVLADPRLRDVDVGVYVRTPAGQALFERQADRPLMPASNMKLVTAATVLRTWGEGYSFPTALYADARPDEAGAIAGNLYLKGLAHPTLDRGFIVRMARKLREGGMSAIKGSVVCAGPVTCDPHPDPCRRDAEALYTMLNKLGVVITGSPRTGEVPAGAPRLCHWQSTTTGELLRDMNKRSDNAIADGFAQALRARHGATGRTYDEFAHQAWQAQGLSLAGCRFVDGSGLSRRNRLTARFLGELLALMRQDDVLRPAFAAALPIAGCNGTLRTRMRGTCAAGRVHAKTGFLTGASTLSGYAEANGQVLCFALLMNNHQHGAEPMREIQNRACVALVQWLSGLPQASPAPMALPPSEPAVPAGG